MKKGNRWTQKEMETLKEAYLKGGTKAALEAFGGRRTRSAIEGKAYIAGLRRSTSRNEKYNPKPLPENTEITRQKFMSDPQRFLRLLRMGAGFTQYRLAAELGAAQATVCQIERGISRNLKTNTLLKIFEFFNLENERDLEKTKEKPPSGNDVQKLAHQVERLADAAEMLTRQFARVLEGLVKVEQHDQALDNLADQVARLSNGNGSGK